jgi:hypothetical protein
MEEVRGVHLGGTLMQRTLWSRIQRGAQLVFLWLTVLLMLVGVGIFLALGGYFLLTAIGTPRDLPDQVMGVVIALCLIALSLALVGNFILIPLGDRAIERVGGILGRVAAVAFCAFWVTMASFLTYHAVIDRGTAMWQRAFYVLGGVGVAGAVLWAYLRPVMASWCRSLRAGGRACRAVPPQAGHLGHARCDDRAGCTRQLPREDAGGRPWNLVGPTAMR